MNSNSDLNAQRARVPATYASINASGDCPLFSSKGAKKMGDPASQKMTRRARPRLALIEPMTASKPGTRLGEQRPKIRGRPFQPGNPGRPPGSKNRVTRLVEQLVCGDAEALSRKMIGLAKQGNVRCLEYCLDRLLPKRSGRPLDLQLPNINSVHDVRAAMAAITTAVNNGDVTAEEAAHLVHWFEAYAKIITTHDFHVRLEALELEAKERRDLDDRSNEQ